MHMLRQGRQQRLFGHSTAAGLPQPQIHTICTSPRPPLPPPAQIHTICTSPRPPLGPPASDSYNLHLAAASPATHCPRSIQSAPAQNPTSLPRHRNMHSDSTKSAQPHLEQQLRRRCLERCIENPQKHVEKGTYRRLFQKGLQCSRHCCCRSPPTAMRAAAGAALGELPAQAVHAAPGYPGSWRPF